MENLIKEASILYKKTFDSFMNIKWTYKNDDEEMYVAFIQKHFIKMNNLVLSCNHLNSLGYADEVMILSRTMLELFIDFLEVFKNKDIIANIDKFFTHQQLYPYFKFYNFPELIRLIEQNEDIVEERKAKFESIFIKYKDKWYGKTIGEAILHFFKDNKIRHNISEEVLIQYKNLCFYSHGNRINLKNKNQFGKFSNSSIWAAMYTYQIIYGMYIEEFSICTNISDCFVNEHKCLFEKLLTQQHIHSKY